MSCASTGCDWQGAPQPHSLAKNINFSVNTFGMIPTQVRCMHEQRLSSQEVAADVKYEVSFGFDHL